MQRSDYMNKFEIESIIEEYEWLVSFKASEASDLVYVVSINYEDIDWEKCSVEYIHIENIDYLYDISGGDYKIIERCYDDFESIEEEVVKEIKSFL
jgi:hypothetical protein